MSGVSFSSASNPLRRQAICAVLCAAALLAGVWWHALADIEHMREAALSSWEARQSSIAGHIAQVASLDMANAPEDGQSLTESLSRTLRKIQGLTPSSPQSQLFIWTRQGLLHDRRITEPPALDLEQTVARQTRLGGRNLHLLEKAVQDATDGRGRYSWSGTSPMELVSWVSVRLPGDTWTIFLSTPEHFVLKSSGINALTRRNLVASLVACLAILAGLGLLLRELRRRSQADLAARHVQAALDEAQSMAGQLAVALEEMPLAQAVLDAKGHILRANRHFRTATDAVWRTPPAGHALAELPGWNEHEAALHQAQAEAQQQGHASVELSLPGAGSQQRSYELNFSALRQAQASPERPRQLPLGPALLLSMQDVTEARQLSALLLESRSLLEHRVLERTEELARANRRTEESRRRLQALLDNMPDIAWLKDAGGRYISVNIPFAHSLGLESPTQIAGRHDHTLLSAEEIRFTRDIDQVIIASRTSHRVEQPYEIPGLGTRWHEVIRTPIFDDAGLVVGIVGIARDMTERRQMLEELRRSEAELRRLNRLLLSSQEEERTRIGQELHDSIGQMLTGIKWLLERAKLSLGRGKGTLAARTALADVVPMVQRTEEELARVLLALRPKVLDDLGLVAAVQSMCREFEQGNPKMRLVLRITAQEALIAPEVRTTVFRLLQEALNNVARHSAATRMVVWLGTRNGRLVLHVGDNGRGFDARVENPGLGLHNFANRASYAGGACALRTRPGVGTALRFEFPLTAEPEADG